MLQIRQAGLNRLCGGKQRSKAIVVKTIENHFFTGFGLLLFTLSEGNEFAVSLLLDGAGGSIDRTIGKDT